MDASQILNQNLAPMLDAIRSYGQQLSREREIAEQRQYQADLRREERQYQEGRIAEQRAYEESLRLKQRGEKVDDERLSRRRDLSRKISRVFPDDDTQGMSDAQLEKRAIEADQKISRDETLAKSESELRADGVRMGIANAEKMEISELQKQVIEKKNQQIIDTEQNRLKAAEAFQGQRLGTPEGQNAVEAYKRLAREKADTVRSLMTAGEDQEPPPVDPSLIGQRFLQLLQQGDMDTPIEQIEMGKRLYEAITDPRNRDLNARVLQPILAGQKPAASAIASIPNIKPAEMVYLSQLEALAIRDITAQNPKMIQALAAQGRNNVYLQKMAIGEKLREIDSAMKQLTVGFPALSKIPSIDMEFLMSPGVKPAPGTEKPGIPTLPAVSPKGAMMTPAVPAGPEPISGVSVNVPPAAAMSAAWSGQGGVRPSVEMPASAMLASAPAPVIPQPEDSTFVPSLWRGWTDPRNTPLGQIPLYRSMETMQSTGQSVRNFIGPYGEMISGASDRYAMPLPSRLTNAEMLYNPEGYKAFLRSQMGGY